MLHFGLPAHAGFLLTVAVQAEFQAPLTLLHCGPAETGVWLRVPKHICKRAMPAAAPESSNAFQGCGLSTHPRCMFAPDIFPLLQDWAGAEALVAKLFANRGVPNSA